MIFICYIFIYFRYFYTILYLYTIDGDALLAVGGLADFNLLAGLK